MNYGVSARLDNNRTYQKTELYLGTMHISIQPDLSEFNWVNSLDMSGNSLQYINAELLPVNLKELDISDNLIECLDLRACTQLKKLICSKNRIVKCKLPENVKFLDISENSMEKFDNYYSKLKMIDISDNKLRSFNGRLFPKLDAIDCKNNIIADFIFPPELVALNISDNTLEKMENLPKTLTALQCKKNKIKVIENIPSELEEIDISNNNFSSLPDFPIDSKIKKITCKTNHELRELNSVPKSVEFLDMEDCRIRDLSAIKYCAKLKHLNMRNNLVDKLELGYGIETIDVAKNYINKIEYLPASVKTLDVTDNNGINIPTYILNRPGVEIIGAEDGYNTYNRSDLKSRDDDYPFINNDDEFSRFNDYGPYRHRNRYGSPHHSRTSSTSYSNYSTPYSSPYNTKSSASNHNFVSFGNNKKEIL